MTESQLADAIMHEPDMVKRLASIIDVGRKKYTSLIPNLEVLARDENYIVRSHAIWERDGRRLAAGTQV